MRIAIIDNYDSFTYNLQHLVESLGPEVRVMRNDRFEMGELAGFDKIILSPGPGIPSEAGQLMATIREWAGIKPILGICLGHQAIGEVYGGKLVNLANVVHGVATPANITQEDYLLDGIKPRFTVGRYHSWVVEAETLPECLEATSMSEDGCIMSLRHKKMDVRGLQFHPESVLTPDGEKIISNWLKH